MANLAAAAAAFGGWVAVVIIAILLTDATHAFGVDCRHTTTTSTRLQVAVPEPEALIPESNPYYKDDSAAASSNDDNHRRTVSLAGVSYAKVLKDVLDVWFPPHDLGARTATSRTDGYWPYLQQGHDPPQELTYGEFDAHFFATVLDRAGEIWQANTTTTKNPWTDRVFVDVGSGAGRLVVAAAALHPTLRQARGIELLPGLHASAVDTWQRIQQQHAEEAGGDSEDRIEKDDKDGDNDKPLALAPVEFVCASFEDPYDASLWDADLLFFFSTCLPDHVLETFSQTVGRQCRPGTLIVTTDRPLYPLQGNVPPVDGDDRIPSGINAYQFELLEELPGWSWIQGGESVAYIHRLERSLWKPHKEGGPPWTRPVLSVQEICYRAAMALEQRDTEDVERFLRGVYNNCVFHGLPERWYARLRDRIHNGPPPSPPFEEEQP